MHEEFEDPVFNINNVDDDQLGHMEYIVNSPSWQQVFRPFFLSAVQMYKNLLADPNPDVRKQWGGSKYLRAGAQNTTKIVEFFDKIIAETQDERAMKARDSLGQEDLYRVAVEQGIIRGAGMVASDYPEDTEF